MESWEISGRKQIPRVIIPETDESSSDESIQPTLNRKKKSCVRSDSEDNNSPNAKKLRLQIQNNQNDELPAEIIRETSKLTISQDSRSSFVDLRLTIKLSHDSPKATTSNHYEKNDSGASQDIFDSESLDEIVEFSNNSLTTFSDDDAASDLISRGFSNDSMTEPPKRVRHKIARPHEWKQNKRRIARNLGLPYKSHNGVCRLARKLLPPCNCQLRCHEKFTEMDRGKIFEGFWSLGDINRQRELIGKLIKIKKINRHRTTEEDVSRRRCTLRYRFKKADKFIRTCKVFFLNTLGIGEKILRVMVNKHNRSETGALSPDRRGRNVPRNKLTAHDIAGINRHISLLPKVPAHWCRRDSTKIYLEGNLNQETVYQLYKSYASEHGLRQVSKPTYVRQLNFHNIGYHQPRKDQCWCARFYEFPEEDRIARQEEYNLHVRRKEAARKEKMMDTDAARNPKVITACFDMEALLYSPWTSSKQLFYRRKFATHNFTVFSIRRKQGYCYMWPEHFGNKGSQEIATCLRKYIIEEVPNGVKKLTFYADNCAGQNKNSVIAVMLGKALQMHPSLKKINLKFLEVGHTFMECDTMHSTIERASRHENIYVPADWAKIARHAKKTGNQYSVFSMTHDDFLNFKAVRDKIFSNNLRFTDSTKVKWKLAKCIQIRRDRLRSIFIKNEYWEPFKEIILRKAFTSGNLKILYDEPIPIKKAKHDDLMHLCRANIIPQQYHQFYRDLPVDENDGDELNLHDGRARVPRRRQK